MKPAVGRAVLVLSAVGFPLTQVVIRRSGRAGAAAVEAVSLGLLARDAALIGLGAGKRLRRGPAALLWLEAGFAALASLAGLRLLVDEAAGARAASTRPDPAEAVRRAALGTLFGLHTMRFRIYLSPDRGLRAEEPGEEHPDAVPGDERPDTSTAARR